jgi:hypothetical protein
MPLLQLATVLIVVGGLPWLVNRFIPTQDFVLARVRTQINKSASGSYDAALWVVLTEEAEGRNGAERRWPCCGQFS